MWMLFSLTTLVLLAVGIARWRGRRHWDGDRRGDLRVAVSTRKDKNSTHPRITRVRVGLQVRDVLAFECRAETAFDRFAVGLGLAQETELGRRAFDRAVYLLTDDPAVATWLRSRPALTTLLAQAFGEGGDAPLPVRGLACHGGLLWLEFGPPRGGTFVEEVVVQYASRVLREIAEALPSTRPSASTGDRGVWGAALVLGCSSALGVTALLQLFKGGLPGWPIVLDPAAAEALGWKAGVALFAALLGLALWLVGRRARLPLVLLEVCTVGLFGALVCRHAGTREFNRLLDGSAPQLREAVVSEASMTQRQVRRRRGRTRTVTDYHLAFETPPGTQAPPRTEVDRATWSRFEQGQRVLLVEREGAFGIRWLEDVRPAP
jgi:hypothetical protein